MVFLASVSQIVSTKDFLLPPIQRLKPFRVNGKNPIPQNVSKAPGIESSLISTNGDLRPGFQQLLAKPLGPYPK